MLSQRGARRREGAGSRRGGGGRVADRAEELEEGEACSSDGNGNGDGEAFFDPDVALSYIDEKLQHILGHFQKDFEGGVSAENLGSKYGGYGSFLPTYQRSPPLLPQSRSPHIATSRSPHQPSAEGMAENPSTMPVESISRNKGSRAPLSSDLLEKERCSSTNREESVADSDSLGSSFNGSDAMSLKVRTKICSNNALPRKNAAIYSGLGLDISSSSSMEESPDRLGGLSPEVSKVPYESPRTILQVMTCFPVPGGFLLSPLSRNLLQLTNNVAPLLQKRETHLDMENVPRAFEGHSQSSLPPGPVRNHVAKQMKPVSMKKMPEDKKTMKDKGDISAVMNKEVNMGMPAGQGIISDMPAPTMEINNESQFAHETRNTGMSRLPERNEDVRLEEQIGGNDLAAVKDEAIKAETKKYTENSGFHNSKTCNLAQKGKPKIKKGKADIDVEERDVSNHKSSLFDRKKKHKVKAEREFEAGMVDCEPCDDRNGDGNLQSKGKRIQKEHQVKGAASYDLVEDDNYTHSSAAVMDGKNGTQQKSCSFENKAKSHKDLGEKLPNINQGDMEGLLDSSAQLELGQKEKRMNINNENAYDVGSSRKDISTRQLHMPSTSVVATANADPVPAPAVIKEHWVCCDICHKWRLLPYKTNPSMLPKKWKCSMLYWLPGMNRCEISENETTDALNALYATPATGTSVSTGGPRTAGAETSSAYNIGGQLEQSRKRKNTLSDGNCLVDSSYHTPLSVPLMSNQQDPSKSKTTTDGERDSLSKHGLGPVNKSADLVSEKQKPKHKNHSGYSHEGDPMERTIAQSKMKSKRGFDRDEHKTYKKTKKEDWHQIDRDQDRGRDSDGREIPAEPKALPAKGKNVKALEDPIAHENKNIGSETRQDSGSGHQLGMPFGKEKTHLRNDNQDIQNPVTQVVNLAKQKVSRSSLKPDSSKMKVKSMRPIVENGVQPKQAISNPSDASPMRKDGSMVAFALKEARDLKHKANDLKNRGLELESTGLYFEAALKFLHVAFLLETPTFVTSRPGDAAQSMKMYSETAKLCSFCAHEYERCKKMAAAALAYKCVEVAYLKAAYYKHPSARKDRQELQGAIQIAPGESPSSSASDIDNLSSSHLLSKAPLVKDQNSPQVAGDHLPLAVRNQATLLRLLAYTNDVNCAFDATRKSEVAIASAVGSQERGKIMDDGLPLVKTVLDLNFNNVNELLRLVRLSMESISS